MVANTPIFTVGHGGRQLDEFLELLRLHGIQHVIDVRTVPFSRYQPEFSRDALERTLRREGVKYVFMGESLGGRPVDASCYTGGRVDYEKCMTHPAFRRGLARLLRASRKNLRITLLCSEGKPENCHRSKLIGEALRREVDVSLQHIDPDGRTRTQSEVMLALDGGQLNLFGGPLAPLRSRNTYGP